MAITFEFRDMTDSEYKRELEAFDEHSAEFGNPPDAQERFGYVATDKGKFVGCSSGLAQKHGAQYGKYFYLSDLLVEKEYRKLGYGQQLLQLLENKVKGLGVEYVWTWTASYEAETFYLKQSYEVFVKFEKFYPSGHARVGLVKRI